MKVKILGCGSSFGVPLIGNKFGNCDANNEKNYRTRPSILIQENNCNLLIDTSPDLRSQLLKANCDKIDAVLYTHKHADHIHGINDLRALSLIMKNRIPAWGSKETIEYLKNNFSYIFNHSQNYDPIMVTNTILDEFFINNVKINTFQHNHGNIDCTTYIINNFAYITDINKLFDDMRAYIMGRLDTPYLLKDLEEIYFSGNKNNIN